MPLRACARASRSRTPVRLCPLIGNAKGVHDLWVQQHVVGLAALHGPVHDAAEGQAGALVPAAGLCALQALPVGGGAEVPVPRARPAQSPWC